MTEHEQPALGDVAAALQALMQSGPMATEQQAVDLAQFFSVAWWGSVKAFGLVRTIEALMPSLTVLQDRAGQAGFDIVALTESISSTLALELEQWVLADELGAAAVRLRDTLLALAEAGS